ncbi:MAG TPA: DUF4430 domain-containing protein [Clostridiaceae bacterium]|nr:DUF4430 domain-containing protein [Clostridiaceae bacterium]
MRKLRYLLGVFLSLSLLVWLAGCSCNSAESVNLEKQSIVSSENLRNDQIKSESTEERKSANEVADNSEQIADADNKSQNNNELNENQQSETSANSSDSKGSKKTEAAAKEVEVSSAQPITNTNSRENTEETIAVTQSNSDDYSTIEESLSGTQTVNRATTSNDRTSGSKTSTVPTTAAPETVTTIPVSTTADKTTETVPDTIRVQISVDCVNAYNAGNEIAQAISSDGWILGATIYEMPKNSTVYDLIMATDLVIGARTTNFGVYIYSIQSLAEFAVGGNGGWLYSVNGSQPSVGVDSYILQPGDIVHFSYTVDLGDF